MQRIQKQCLCWIHTSLVSRLHCIFNYLYFVIFFCWFWSLCSVLSHIELVPCFSHSSLTHLTSPTCKVVFFFLLLWLPNVFHLLICVVNPCPCLPEFSFLPPCFERLRTTGLRASFLDFVRHVCYCPLITLSLPLNSFQHNPFVQFLSACSVL